MTLILNSINKQINKNWIIQDLSLKVKDGECLAILGPSGCGKSTTLRLIAGLEICDSGSIFINDEDITNISPVDRKIGMVFQSYALFPHLTIYENLSLGLKIRGISKKESIRRVSSILDLLKLEHLSTRKPAALSGGQRQRVALARALLRDPSLYLLDEPMSNLDAQLRERLRPELRRLILNGNQPVIYVTHDQHEAMSMANRIAILNDGRLVQIGTPKDIYKTPASIFVASFVGRPQINLFPESAGLIKGIRPEDIFLDNKGIDFKILYTEWLGTNQLFHLDTSQGRLRMLCNADISINSDHKINWKQEKLHLFDSKTKLRINNG